MTDEMCSNNNAAHDNSLCGFAWKIAETLETLQRTAFEYGKDIDIDIEGNEITIKLGGIDGK